MTNPSSPNSSLDSDPVLRTKDVLRMLNVSRTTLWNHQQRGEGPLPFPIFPGGSAKGYRRSHVQNYINRRGDDSASKN